MNIKGFFEALMAGKRLSNASTWKQVQNAVNALTVIITFVVSFFPETVQVSEENAATVAEAIVIIVGIFNAYVTTASSRKVGIGEPL